jgi:hypothetical protein
MADRVFEPTRQAWESIPGLLKRSPKNQHRYRPPYAQSIRKEQFKFSLRVSYNSMPAYELPGIEQVVPATCELLEPMEAPITAVADELKLIHH